MFDLDEQGVWAVVALAAGFALMLVTYLTSPRYFLFFTYFLFLLAAVLITQVLVILSLLIGIRLGNAVERILDRWFDIDAEAVVRVLGFVGLGIGLWRLVLALIAIEWREWGFRGFIASMESGRPGTGSVFGRDTWPFTVVVMKGLLGNVGSVFVTFVTRLLAPWTWLSTCWGMLTGD